MIENRFRLLYSQLGSGMFVDKEEKIKSIIIDKEFQKIGLLETLDLLNELAKENEQLKTLLRAYQKSVEDYKYQIRKAIDEKLSIIELADNCGVDVE